MNVLDYDVIDALISPLGDIPERLVITGGVVYVGDVAGTVMPEATIIAEHGTIVDVTTDVVDPTPNELRLDARGTIVMPGFVDPHYHEIGPYRFLHLATAPERSSPYGGRGFDLGGDLMALSRSLGERPRLLTSLSTRHVTLGVVYGAWQLLQRGITSVGDFGSPVPGDALATVFSRCGLRARVGLWASDLLLDNHGVTRLEDADTLLSRLAGVLSAIEPLERVEALPSAMMVTTCSDELLRGVVELARTHGSPWGIHLAALASENAISTELFGRDVIARASQLGVIDDGLIAAHTAYASEHGRHLLRDRGVHVTHSPAKYGTSGEDVLQQRGWLDLIDSGVAVSISCDAEVFPIGGPLEAMRAAWFGTNTLANNAGRLDSVDVLAMATSAPAAALRWADRVGTIAPGKRCDLVTVRVDDWRHVGAARPLDTALHLGGSSDIDTVLIDGRVVVERGRARCIDVEQLTAWFIESCAETLAALDLAPGSWARNRLEGIRR